MRQYGLTYSLLLLAACSGQPTVQDKSSAHLLETEELAATAYENNEWLESEKHYSVLVDNNPEQPLHWLRLGNIYAQTRRPDEAIYAYEAALARDPDLVDAWYNMGVIRLKQAAYSLNEMQLHSDPGNPLAERARRLLEGILELIQVNGEN